MKTFTRIFALRLTLNLLIAFIVLTTVLTGFPFDGDFDPADVVIERWAR